MCRHCTKHQEHTSEWTASCQRTQGLEGRQRHVHNDQDGWISTVGTIKTGSTFYMRGGSLSQNDQEGTTQVPAQEDGGSTSTPHQPRRSTSTPSQKEGSIGTPLQRGRSTSTPVGEGDSRRIPLFFVFSSVVSHSVLRLPHGLRATAATAVTHGPLKLQREQNLPH